MTTYRREWLQADLMSALRERYDVRVEQVAVRAPSSSARVASRAEMLLVQGIFFLRLALSPSLYDRERRIVCFGGHYGTMLFAQFRSLLRRPPKLYLLNIYLHELGERTLVKRILARLMPRDARVVAQSEADARYFAQFLPPSQVTMIPFCSSDDDHLSHDVAETGEYVFAGGWTNRDYDALLRAAARLPQVPFVVVASRHSDITAATPANVRMLRDLPYEEFERMAARSRFVVVPLKSDVGSSGQMVALTAMHYGKALVVPDIPAISGYVESGVTGLTYPLGDDGALAEAVAALYDDVPRAARLGEAGRDRYLRRFTMGSYVTPIVDLVAA